MVAAAQKFKILVVEDDRDTAQTLAKWLQTNGHDVVVAQSRDEAAQRLSGFQPQIIFLDYWMSGMTASVFSRRVRTQFPGAKIVIITAASHAFGIARMLDADAHFGKPFDFDKIENYLSGAL